jgi:hypothetical protein
MASMKYFNFFKRKVVLEMNLKTQSIYVRLFYYLPCDFLYL